MSVSALSSGSNKELRTTLQVWSDLSREQCPIFKENLSLHYIDMYFWLLYHPYGSFYTCSHRKSCQLRKYTDHFYHILNLISPKIQQPEFLFSKLFVAFKKLFS